MKAPQRLRSLIAFTTAVSTAVFPISDALASSVYQMQRLLDDFSARVQRQVLTTNTYTAVIASIPQAGNDLSDLVSLFDSTSSTVTRLTILAQLQAMGTQASFEAQNAEFIARIGQPDTNEGGADATPETRLGPLQGTQTISQNLGNAFAGGTLATLIGNPTNTAGGSAAQNLPGLTIAGGLGNTSQSLAVTIGQLVTGYRAATPLATALTNIQTVMGAPNGSQDIYTRVGALQGGQTLTANLGNGSSTLSSLALMVGNPTNTVGGSTRQNLPTFTISGALGNTSQSLAVTVAQLMAGYQAGSSLVNALDNFQILIGAPNGSQDIFTRLGLLQGTKNLTTNLGNNSSTLSSLSLMVGNPTNTVGGSTRQNLPGLTIAGGLSSTLTSDLATTIKLGITNLGQPDSTAPTTNGLVDRIGPLQGTQSVVLNLGNAVAGGTLSALIGNPTAVAGANLPTQSLPNSTVGGGLGSTTNPLATTIRNILSTLGQPDSGGTISTGSVAVRLGSPFAQSLPGGVNASFVTALGGTGAGYDLATILSNVFGLIGTPNGNTNMTVRVGPQQGNQNLTTNLGNGSSTLSSLSLMVGNPRAVEGSGGSAPQSLPNSTIAGGLSSTLTSDLATTIKLGITNLGQPNSSAPTTNGLVDRIGPLHGAQSVVANLGNAVAGGTLSALIGNPTNTAGGSAAQNLPGGTIIGGLGITATSNIANAIAELISGFYPGHSLQDAWTEILTAVGGSHGDIYSNVQDINTLAGSDQTNISARVQAIYNIAGSDQTNIFSKLQSISVLNNGSTSVGVSVYDDLNATLGGYSTYGCLTHVVGDTTVGLGVTQLSQLLGAGSGGVIFGGARYTVVGTGSFTNYTSGDGNANLGNVLRSFFSLSETNTITIRRVSILEEA